MRVIKTADGNCYYIIDGNVSDARGYINGCLSKIPRVRIGESVEICYAQRGSDGELIRDDAGMLKTKVWLTAPVVA